MKKVFILAFSILFLVPANSGEINPEAFIDSNAQSMVQVIVIIKIYLNLILISLKRR